MKLLIILLFLNLAMVSACQQEHKSEPVQKSEPAILSQEPENADSAKTSLTFLDSVSRQYDLTIAQIKAHTLIPDFYYTGRLSVATFSGNTVINLAYGFKGAVLNYSDGLNCSYKFLLVMDTAKNINVSYHQIYSVCDRDESAGYVTLDYKFLNDSLFDIIETGTSESSEVKHFNTEIKKWRIRKDGKINPVLKSSIHGK
jgi:hypothetical protein